MSERSSRLVDQLALTFEELEASATEDELAAEQAVANEGNRSMVPAPSRRAGDPKPWGFLAKLPEGRSGLKWSAR
jgi:hypothetical protein